MWKNDPVEEEKEVCRACNEAKAGYRPSSLLTNLIDLPLERQPVKTGQGKGKKQADSPVQHEVSITEGAFDLFGCATHRRRIGNTPMRGHGLTGPDRADLFGGVIAYREDEIQRG